MNDMNIIELDKIKKAYNKMNEYIPLTEASLTHILKKEKYDECYVIISACRKDWDSNNKEHNNQINNALTKELASKIKDNGYGYVPVFGGFIENKDTPRAIHTFEKSFLIFPYSNKGEKRDFQGLADFAFTMGVEYRQDSVLIKEPTIDGDIKAPYYIVTTDHNEYKVGDKQMYFGKDTYKINDITQEHFTAMRKRASKYDDETDNTRRFTLTECYVLNDPQSYNNAMSRYMSGEIVNYNS